MADTILVAGATGNLGRRITQALKELGAKIRALARTGSNPDKLAKLEQHGAEIVTLDMEDTSALTRACEGVACVVSALQGLREVIVDTQSRLLHAAIAEGVPRFIPSDYAIDYTKLPAGENRNLDLRREFQERIDGSSIAATSVLNGAFAELLTSAMPLLDFKAKQVRHWENADQPLDFTTMDNTAAFTAAVAMDTATPRFLRIAGDTISARELATLTGFELVRLGSLDDLTALIVHTRAADPESEKEEYPAWQGMQYMHNMFSGRAKLEPLDNDRYPTLQWTSVPNVLTAR
ncbi:MAG: NmrA family NAD(P)-binding protein [Armatimonas sp.]